MKDTAGAQMSNVEPQINSIRYYHVPHQQDSAHMMQQQFQQQPQDFGFGPPSNKFMGSGTTTPQQKNWNDATRCIDAFVHTSMTYDKLA